MPAPKPVLLHKGKSVRSLKEFYDNVNFHGRDVQKLCKSLGAVLQKGRQKRREGDEEESFIYFMKSLNILSYIKKSDEYSKNKSKYDSLLPKENWGEIMAIAEQLSDSLEERYKQLDIVKIEAEKKQEEDKKESTKNDESKKPEPKIITNVSTPPNGLGENGCITTMQLFKLLELARSSQSGRKESVLILDTRRSSHFKESHLSIGDCLSVPEEIITSGLTASKLAQSLSSDSRFLWERRTEVDYLILMDWSSGVIEHGPPSSVHLLRQILTEWDPGVTYKSKPLILDGGYEGWLECYPMHVTNPKPSSIPSKDSLDDLLDIDDVQYPNIMDETPNLKSKPSTIPDIMFNGPNTPTEQKNGTQIMSSGSSQNLSSPPFAVPSVDRSSKAAALLKLEERKARVIEHSEELTRNRKEAENELEVVKKQQQNQAQLGEKQKQELLVKEQLLEDHIKLLLKSQREKETENESLRKQLEEYKKRCLEASVRKNPKPTYTADNSVVKQTNEVENGGSAKIERSLSNERKNAQDVPPGSDCQISDEVVDDQNKLKNIGDAGESGTYTVSLQSELDIPAASSGMKRSRSSPNIAQLGQEHKFSMPHIDRTTKPPVSKPLNNEFINRPRNFHEVYGNVGSGLTGLKNLGNSCYMNSILQCISNTPRLTTYFCNGTYQDHVNHSRSNPTRGEVAVEVAHVVRNLWLGQYRSIACRDLKTVVGKYLDQFRGNMQQDSHEFLTFLIDWLHNDLKVRRQKVAQEVADSGFHSQTLKADALTGATKAWNEFKKSNESFILNLFFVQQVSTVRCNRCHEESITYEEPASNLTLILPSSSRCHLKDCLQLYTCGERISGYKCESCKEQQEATKKVDLWRLPPILVIHLKRFYSDGFYQKRQTFVDFPLMNLDMREYTLDRSQRYTNYSLYGVSNHYGTLEGGHYTAFCKNKNQWYKFDDQDVSEISPSEVKSPYAYILFYHAEN